MDQQIQLQKLSKALEVICDALNLSPSYLQRVEPLEPRSDHIHLTFTFDEEELADKLIRTARRKLASFGPEYWLPDYHPSAAQFCQTEHMQFKVRKSLIVSHLYWGVSFILCAPNEGYSLLEDSQS